MRWRVAKKIALATNCGCNCHTVKQFTSAELKFCRVMKRSPKRRVRYLSRILYWNKEYLELSGFQVGQGW